jgi:hypothetical protein
LLLSLSNNPPRAAAADGAPFDRRMDAGVVRAKNSSSREARYGIQPTTLLLGRNNNSASAAEKMSNVSMDDLME